jgi:hypothetical protein
MPIRTIWAERVTRRVGALLPLYERHVERVLGAHAPADPVVGTSLARDGIGLRCAAAPQRSVVTRTTNQYFSRMLAHVALCERQGLTLTLKQGQDSLRDLPGLYAR